MLKRKITRRSMLRTGAGALGAVAIAKSGFPAPAIAQSKPFDGLTLKGASFQHGFFTILQNYIPEFEEMTGMKVEIALSSFPVYNQQADLELSTGGDAFDFVNVTFILGARWVAANLLANLDDFSRNPEFTPADWDPDDFVEGAQVPYRDAAGNTFGYSWEGGAMVMGVGRPDLLKKAGVGVPTTFEELMNAVEAVHGMEDTAGYVAFNLHHWNLPPYVHGFGGDLFKDPPNNITPTLDSPETVQGADFYARLLREFGPQGALGFTEDQAKQTMLDGRAVFNVHASSWVTPILTDPNSKVSDQAIVTRMPAGPAGDFPASNSQGLGIPKNAKNKEAAWEFIKWALSRELSMRIVNDFKHFSLVRRSVIDDPEYRALNLVKGQDLASLYLGVLELPGQGRNYMAYRTVKEFPQIGDPVNKGVERIASGQMSAAESMKIAQEEAVNNLRRVGAKIDL